MKRAATATKTRTPTSERRARRRDRRHDRGHRQPALARKPPQPRIAAEFQAIVGERAGYSRPRRIEELDELSRRSVSAPPTVDRGARRRRHPAQDGHRAGPGLRRGPDSADRDLVRRHDERRGDVAGYPRAPGGFPAGDCRATRNGQLARDHQAPLPAHRRQLGFLFGSGLPANFLTEYYGARRLRPGTRGLAAHCGRSSRRCGAGRSCGSCSTLRGLGARRRHAARTDRVRRLWRGTVREVGLGFSSSTAPTTTRSASACWPCTRRPVADPRPLGGAAGRGIAPSRAFSAVASRMDVHSKDGSMAYTIDGDLYRTQDPGAISIGPPVAFVRPPSR